MVRVRDKIRVAMMRAKPVAGDMEANWQSFARLARQAARRKADVFVSPESFLDGYAVYYVPWDRRQLMTAGRLVARQYVPRLQRLARQLEMMIVLGVTYTGRGGKCWNSAFLVGADGRVIGRYDKTHLRDHDLKFDPGMSLPVFDTPFGKVGIMICADRRWPETVRTLRLRGARIILNPTYGMCHMANEWWMRTRSAENGCYICFTHAQVSLVTDPRGDIHAKVRHKRPGVLVTDIDLSQASTGMLAARRPELYGPLLWPVKTRRP